MDIGGFCPSDGMISQLSHQVAWIQEWYFSWRLKKLDIIFGIPNFQGEKLSPSVPIHIRELQDKLIYRLSGDNELMIDYVLSKKGILQYIHVA